MLISLYACMFGFVLDLIIGDPYWRFHPIRIIGNLITTMEKFFRNIFHNSDRGKLMAGLCMTIVVSMLSMTVPYILLVAAKSVNFLLAFFLESIMFAFIFSTKSLKVETMKIYQLLKDSNLKESRQAVSMIVGRDTEKLDKKDIVKAVVETISENTTDGVIAPLFFGVIGGAPLAFLYKAVNTMDSMVGYKNKKYILFGRYSAKLDDVLNYLPARIAARMMILSTYVLKGFDSKQATIIYKRDKYKHASPNSAHTEAVCAGALRIQLAGDAYYFGVKHKKEYIGDSLESITPEHIIMANKLMYVTSVISLILFSCIKFLIIY